MWEPTKGWLHALDSFQFLRPFRCTKGVPFVSRGFTSASHYITTSSHPYPFVPPAFFWWFCCCVSFSLCVILQPKPRNRNTLWHAASTVPSQASLEKMCWHKATQTQTCTFLTGSRKSRNAFKWVFTTSNLIQQLGRQAQHGHFRNAPNCLVPFWHPLRRRRVALAFLRRNAANGRDVKGNPIGWLDRVRNMALYQLSRGLC